MKDPILKSKRLILRPMTNEELTVLMNNTSDEELKAAYGEMLDGCISHPTERLWYTAWQINLNTDGSFVGDLCFKGPQQNGAVEIGYGIVDSYRNNGYATEACRCIIDWAFSQTDVYFVEAEAEIDNAASIKVLSKLCFKKYGQGIEGPRFVLEKTFQPLLTLYMLLGMSIGLAIGMLSSPPIGLSAGMLLGLVIGFFIDSDTKKRMNRARNIRYNSLTTNQPEN